MVVSDFDEAMKRGEKIAEKRNGISEKQKSLYSEIVKALSLSERKKYENALSEFLELKLQEQEVESNDPMPDRDQRMQRMKSMVRAHKDT
jgi:hypothetical protein